MSKRSKTVEFPRYKLQRCEEWLEEIPPSKSADRETLSSLMGYTTPISMSAGSARGAMVMFGLMISEDGKYSMTRLGRALRSPVSTIQRNFLRIVAFLNPDRFQQMFCKLIGPKIENRRYLRNLAAQKYKLTDKVARKYERVFIDSGIYAGLLREVENAIHVVDISPALEEFDVDLNSLYDLASSEDAMHRFLEIIEDKDMSPSKKLKMKSESEGISSDLDTERRISFQEESESRKGSFNLSLLSEEPLVHEPSNRILPCHNLSLHTQMDLLKAIVSHHESRNQPASRSDIASIVDVSTKNIGSCTSFWRSLGFISGEGDEWLPKPPLVEFVSNMEWGRPDDAKEILRQKVANAWFGRHALSSLSVRNEMTKEELMNTLGRASELSIEKNTTLKRLRYLVELLELSGLIEEFDEETYRIPPDFGQVRIGAPEKSQPVSSLHSKSAISNKMRYSYFEIGRLMGNLEQLGIHAEKEQISEILEPLSSHLEPFDELLVLLESLENNYVLAADNENPGIYLSNLSFLIEKTREKLGISIETENKEKI